MTEDVFVQIPDIQSKLLWPVERGSGPAVVAQALGTNRVVVAEQVHGTVLHVVELGDPGEIIGADGLVATAPDIALAAVGADCQVLFAVDPIARVIGIAHAGWRGIVADIGPQFVEVLVAQGSDRSRLRIHVGPSVGPCHYVVKPDVFKQFQTKFGTDVAFERAGESVLDLRAAQRQTLLAAGIRADQLTIDPRCTVCAPEYFPSHRREGSARTTNLIGALVLRPSRAPASSQ